MFEMENKLEVFYIDDCIRGTLDVFDSDQKEVFNIGSEESLHKSNDRNIEQISNYKISKNYQLNKPVLEVDHDNTLINKN